MKKDKNRIACYCYLSVNINEGSCYECPYNQTICSAYIKCIDILIKFMIQNLDVLYCLPDDKMVVYYKERISSYIISEFYS